MKYPAEEDGLMRMLEEDDDLEEDKPLVPGGQSKYNSVKSKNGVAPSKKPRRLCFLCSIIAVVSFSAYLVSRKPKDLPSDLDEEQDIVYQSNSSDVLSYTDTESKDDEDEDKPFEYPPIIPEVAWIMSFGGSGTSYTILNTEALTEQSTASNYARDYETLVPVHPDYPNGPYIRSLNKPLPSEYILTKTHCGGYCMDCPPGAYYFSSTDEFKTACVSGHAHDMFNEMTTTTYSSSIPQRAVHLVRSPFDNIVGRFHLSIKRFKQRGQDTINFPNNATGLHNWCRYLDDKYRSATADRIPALRPYLDVPCYAEWFRYIQWHNLATAVTDQLHIPVHHLWYDNYTHDFEGTVTQLFDFLHLDATGEPYEWHAGHSYRDFFPTPKAAISMMRDLATDGTWELIAGYAKEYLETTTTSSSSADDDGLVEEPDDTSSSSSSSPHVAWLLSFPNSGTSYTITNVEQMTGATTATNYAADLVGATPLTPNGPYLHTADRPIPGTVLTKTHCTGYCADCGPQTYQTVDFQQGCLFVERPGGVEHTHYDASVPDRIVHLFRNPMDNIVSRMHLSLKKKERDASWTREQLNQFNTTREGLSNWCQLMDGSYQREELSSFSVDLNELFASVPCHADFYRYTMWHNRAIEMAKNLGLPVHYLFYEDYTTEYTATVENLLDFLDLEASNEPRPFIPGKSYVELFESNASISRLVEAVASEETWELLRHYFE